MAQYTSKDLKQFGFTPLEAKIYRIGLQHGTSTVTRLARAVGSHRVVVYSALQELCKQGYATSSLQKNTGLYTMLPPTAIEQKLQEKISVFVAMKPFLESLIQEQVAQFRVETYQGFEGICAMYNKILKTSSSMCAFLGIDHIDGAIKEWLYSVYLPQRVANKITTKTIVSYSEENKGFSDPKKVALTEVLITQDRLFDLQCEIILYDENKIHIASLSTDELSGVVIESTYLYTSLKNIFDLVWRLHRKE